MMLHPGKTQDKWVFGDLSDVQCNELLVHAADVEVDRFSVLSNGAGTYGTPNDGTDV